MKKKNVNNKIVFDGKTQDNFSTDDICSCKVKTTNLLPQPSGPTRRKGCISLFSNQGDR